MVTVNVHVWMLPYGDACSRALIGVAEIPMSLLLRGDRSAVQHTDAFSVVRSHCGASVPDQLGAGGFGERVGALYLRVANVGRPLGYSGLVYADPLADINGDRENVVDVQKAVCTTVNPLTQDHGELERALIRARVQFQGEGTRNDNVRAMKDELPRHDARGPAELIEMARRCMSKLKPRIEPYSHLPLMDQRIQLVKEQFIINRFRREREETVIRKSLRKYTSIRRELDVSFGSASFFEIVFKNPSATEHTYQVCTNDDRLRIVHSVEEWKGLRGIFDDDADNGGSSGGEAGGSTSKRRIEADLMTADGKLCLLPHEEVSIPFKFLSYAAGDVHAHPSVHDAWDWQQRGGLSACRSWEQRDSDGDGSSSQFPIDVKRSMQDRMRASITQSPNAQLLSHWIPGVVSDGWKLAPLYGARSGNIGGSQSDGAAGATLPEPIRPRSIELTINDERGHAVAVNDILIRPMPFVVDRYVRIAGVEGEVITKTFAFRSLDARNAIRKGMASVATDAMLSRLVVSTVEDVVSPRLILQDTTRVGDETQHIRAADRDDVTLDVRVTRHGRDGQEMVPGDGVPSHVQTGSKRARHAHRRTVDEAAEGKHTPALMLRVHVGKALMRRRVHVVVYDCPLRVTPVDVWVVDIDSHYRLDMGAQLGTKSMCAVSISPQAVASQRPTFVDPPAIEPGKHNRRYNGVRTEAATAIAGGAAGGFGGNISMLVQVCVGPSTILRTDVDYPFYLIEKERGGAGGGPKRRLRESQEGRPVADDDTEEGALARAYGAYNQFQVYLNPSTIGEVRVPLHLVEREASEDVVAWKARMKEETQLVDIIRTAGKMRATDDHGYWDPSGAVPPTASPAAAARSLAVRRLLEPSTALLASWMVVAHVQLPTVTGRCPVMTIPRVHDVTKQRLRRTPFVCRKLVPFTNSRETEQKVRISVDRPDLIVVARPRLVMRALGSAQIELGFLPTVLHGHETVYLMIHNSASGACEDCFELSLVYGLPTGTVVT